MKTFVIADPHFGHKGVTHFTKADGSKLRPWDTVEEMDAALVATWNSVVTDHDLVYVLGDFCINRRALPLATRLKGRKKLVAGNHDTMRAQEYLDVGFEDIKACVVQADAILTHIPIHPACMNRWQINIHGHLHSKMILHGGLFEFWDVIDSRYRCVSAENINFTPLDLNEILKDLR